ncbi:MAG: sigma-70 family RNA polymerase sigma factor [Planctomycetota bacterium]
MRGDSDPAARSPAGGLQPDADAAELADLVARAADGSERAWEDLVHRYARRIFAMANAKLRRPELAEEITQSVFVTLATKLKSDGYTELGRFEPWLFRVAMNRVRDEVRRAKRQATPHDPSTFAGVPAQADSHAPGQTAEPEALRQAMACLGDADREVIDLRHMGQLGFREIAVLLDEPLGTVLARHHRALKKLKASMTEADSSGSLRTGDDDGLGGNRI